MILSWTVVLDDGTRPFGPGIPVDQRRPLSIVIGEDVSIVVDLVNPVGGVVVLGAGYLQLNARTVSLPQRQILTARSTAAPTNRYAISIAADDTRSLQSQRGEFDLWAVRGGVRTALIPLSEFDLKPSALGVNYL